MPSHPRHSIVVQYSLLFIIILYLFAPSKQLILEGMHQLSHWVSHPSAHTHHHPLHASELAMDHEHKVLQFLSFVSEPQPDEEQEKKFSLTFLDKHLPHPFIAYVVLKMYQTDRFLYLEKVQHINLPTPSPPPQLAS